ncbi:MAG: nucleoside-diphosphate sugar epimerase [Lysobacter sp.]|nr:nucleoside-diphosphate sugar epimerase [Lysobacter sp.]
MRRALVFGASGQIGVPLLDHLDDAGWQVYAVSRDERNDMPGLYWLRGDLNHVEGLPREVDTIFSLGPLDQFARWYDASKIAAERVIAFGSTSIDVKRGSADAGERDVAARLRQGEQGVFETAAERNAAATILRPTLIYGSARDRTLTRIADLAKRWNRFVLPRGANGLRQPVHAHDLAAAAFAANAADATHGKIYALPGGETLPYRDMVARVLATLDPSPQLIELPSPLFNVALLGAKAAGYATGFGEAAVRRMRSDLVFDAQPAMRDFGYAPRLFQPTAGMFEPR